jgi:hypothetical protein
LKGAVVKSFILALFQCFRLVRKSFVPVFSLCCFTLPILLCVTASVYALDVTLAWDANTEPDLAGYKLYYKTGSPGPPYGGTGATEGNSPIDVGNVTQFTIHGLSNGITYHFAATAYDTENLESGYSNEVTYDANYSKPIGGYTADHVIPEAQISQSTTGTGVITIHFKIKDPTSDPCTLHTFQYSTNGGTTWMAPSNGDTSGSLSSGWHNNGGSAYSSAPTFASAQDHSFTFTTKHPEVSGLNGVDQSDVRVRFTVNDGTYDSVLPVASQNFRVDNLNPTGSVSYSDPNPSHVDVGTLTIAATFTEPLGAAPQITIDRPNPMATVGPVPMSGSVNVWTYELTIGRHNGTSIVDGVYSVTISSVSDLFGNTGGETDNFTTDTRDTDGDGQRDYVDTDDDNDALPDVWEEQYGLDPLDSTGANGKDGDFDNDTWSNYEEYIGNTNPADNTSFPTASAPEIVETIPHHNAGIADNIRVPSNSSFCIRVEDSQGIDITDPNSVTFTIDDRVNTVYSRNLTDDTVVRAIKLTGDGNTSVTKLWITYDRSLDTPGNFQFDTMVTVTVDVINRRGVAVQASYDFKVETQQEHNDAHDPANLPDTAPVDPTDPALEGPYDTGIQVTSGELDGAKVISVSIEPLSPYFGPLDEIPSITGGRGAPMNLEPFTVFNTPVKLFVPYPKDDDVTQLAIYVYKGGTWVCGCDSKGRVRPGGQGWMVPGSRVDHTDTDPPTMEIKVYHFSAIQAGPDVGDPGILSLSGAETGGGCFISIVAGE